MRLFEPIEIGHIMISNRIAFAPTHMGYATTRGEITDQHLCHYSARAKGGSGLIIVEGTGITGKYAFSGGRGIVCIGDSYREGFKALAEVIHFAGAKAFVQIVLGQGAQALSSHKRDKDLVAPSAVSTRIDEVNIPKAMRKRLTNVEGEEARAMTTEEISELVDAAVDAARILKDVGFDGIEIHGAHGYLLAEFVSPMFNLRQDEYGGSFDKRMTLPVQLIQRIRRQVGEEFVIGYRMSGSEHVAEGLDLGESVRVAQRLEKEGIDYIHLSSGCHRALKWAFPDQEGAMLAEAQAFKERLSIPVICPNIHNPSTAENALEGAQTDMVSLSRALLVDPDWPRKAKEGRFGEINRCTFCYTCVISMMVDRTSVRCPQNPELGWERFLPKYFPEPRGKIRS